LQFDGQFAGVIGLILKKGVYRNTADIGYWLGEPYWGKEIASDAIKLVIDHAFNVLNIRRLYTAVFDFNKASMRVLEKAGFQKEGRAVQSIIKNGVVHDEVKYGLLNPSYSPNEK